MRVAALGSVRLAGSSVSGLSPALPELGLIAMFEETVELQLGN